MPTTNLNGRVRNSKVGVRTWRRRTATGWRWGEWGHSQVKPQRLARRRKFVFSRGWTRRGGGVGGRSRLASGFDSACLNTQRMDCGGDVN
jgi:hypothetical protein